jgi:outer membrane protein insertion porin family
VRPLGAVLFAAFVVLAGACDDEVIPPRTPTTKAAVHTSTPAERRAAACKAKQLPNMAPVTVADGPADAVAEGAVARVDVVGAPDEAKARAAIGIAAGEPVNVEKTQKAIRNLYALGAFDDVRLEGKKTPEGLVLRFVLTKRPTFGEVVIHGGTLYDAPALAKTLGTTGGAAYDPVALVDARAKLVEALHDRGYADATLSVVGDRAQDGSVDLCVDLHEGNKVTLESISFKGLSKLKEADLRATIDTDHGRINTPGGILDQAKLDDAIAKMGEMFDAKGLAKGRIATKTSRDGDKVSVLFDIEEGPVVHVRRYDVKGDLVAPVAAYKKLLSLKAKDPFSRKKLVDDLQKIADMHQKKGRADLVVQPQTQLDDKNDTVDIVFQITDPKKATAGKAAPPPPKKHDKHDKTKK